MEREVDDQFDRLVGAEGLDGSDDLDGAEDADLGRGIGLRRAVVLNRVARGCRLIETDRLWLVVG